VRAPGDQVIPVLQWGEEADVAFGRRCDGRGAYLVKPPPVPVESRHTGNVAPG